MLYKKICGIAAGLLLSCGIASAQVGESYFGVMPTVLDFEAPDSESFVAVGGTFDGETFTDTLSDFSLTAAPIRIGKQFTENIAAEFRLAFFGLGSEQTEFTRTRNSTGETAKIDYVDAELGGLYGGYIRFSGSVNNKFSPYFIVGFSKMEVDGDGGNEWEDDDASDSGLSYGVGGSAKLEDDWSIEFEYMQYLKELENVNKVTGIGIGITKRF